MTEVTQPPKGRNRWSVRSMGRHAGMSHSTVQRIWAKNESEVRGEILGSDWALSRPGHPYKVLVCAQYPERGYGLL
jgi:hypothetical protein